MPLRYFVNLEQAGIVELSVDLHIDLDKERAHYLTKVMRIRPGAQVDCFDGVGTEFQAELLNATSKRPQLRISQVQALQPAPANSLHIAIGLLKGQAMDRAVQQATELGAARITLLQTSRTNVSFDNRDSSRSDNKRNHWQKIIQGACEQCGRLYLPILYGPMSLQEFFEATSSDDEFMVFAPEGVALPNQMNPASRTLLIGPEGGWSEEELLEFTRRQWRTYCFGGSILRAETSPAIALALVQQAQGWNR